MIFQILIRCYFLSYQDIATQKFSMPSPVRTVIAADFDNDNELEVFFNNIAYRGPSANRLFRYGQKDYTDIMNRQRGAEHIKRCLTGCSQCFISLFKTDQNKQKTPHTIVLCFIYCHSFVSGLTFISGRTDPKIDHYQK